MILSIINRSPLVVFLWRIADGWPVEFVSGGVGPSRGRISRLARVVAARVLPPYVPGYDRHLVAARVLSPYVPGYDRHLPRGAPFAPVRDLPVH